MTRQSNSAVPLLGADHTNVGQWKRSCKFYPSWNSKRISLKLFYLMHCNASSIFRSPLQGYHSIVKDETRQHQPPGILNVVFWFVWFQSYLYCCNRVTWFGDLEPHSETSHVYWQSSAFLNNEEGVTTTFLICSWNVQHQIQLSKRCNRQHDWIWWLELMIPNAWIWCRISWNKEPSTFIFMFYLCSQHSTSLNWFWTT